MADLFKLLSEKYELSEEETSFFATVVSRFVVAMGSDEISPDHQYHLDSFSSSLRYLFEYGSDKVKSAFKEYTASCIQEPRQVV